ncbi:MAG: DUF1361 domain-containing protein [Anaerolineae bacterium]|nr:DUF1361 domain-containing protein [Anaerolineae bacterium]
MSNLLMPPASPARPHSSRWLSRRACAAFAVLGGGSLFVLAMLIARGVLAGRFAYYFLLWNLLLAWIPFISAYIVHHLPRQSVLALFFAALWLLFFPNAPYLVTDLVHLRTVAENRFLWLDIVMMFSFAWLGAMLGFLSLWLMHDWVSRAFGWLSGWLFVVLASGAAGFGVYLGRFMRWNSWDIITEPWELASDIFAPFLAPQAHARSLGFAVLVSAMMLMGYATLIVFAKWRDEG